MKKHTVHRAKTKLFGEQSNKLVYEQSLISELINTPFSVHSFEGQISEKNKNYSLTNRETLCKTIYNQYLNTPENLISLSQIKKLAEEKTFTVSTGHQLSLFTGTLYFIYKILQTINLAEQLQKENPLHHFIPIFWMASEDHDFEEINHTRIFNKKITWGESQGGPVGMYELIEWEEVKNTLKNFYKAHPESEIHSLINSYHGASLSEATRSIVHTLFGKYGLLVIEPNDKALKQLFVSAMLQEINLKSSYKAVTETTKKLSSLNLKQQVNPREINLFYIEKGIRDRIIEKNGIFSISSLGNFSLSELTELIKKKPAHFSPNVILRPLYQEMILPNLAYIGGAGEINYWIQLKTLFSEFNTVFPLICVRNSLLLIDVNTKRKWNNLGFTWKDYFKSKHSLQDDYVAVKEKETLNFDQIDEATKSLAELFKTKIEATDHALTRFADAEVTKLTKQIEQLKAKLIKHKKGSFEVAMKQIEEIKDRLFPSNGLQERSENFFSFCPDGNFSNQIEELKKTIDPFEKDFILVELNE